MLISYSFDQSVLISSSEYGRSESDYGRGLEDAEGDVEEAAADTLIMK